MEFKTPSRISGGCEFLRGYGLLAAAAAAVTNLVHVTGEVDHLVGEAPLIVIPCNELYEVAVFTNIDISRLNIPSKSSCHIFLVENP